MVLQCKKCGGDAFVDSFGLVVCGKCGFAYYDEMLDFSVTHLYQSVSQDLVKELVDWDSYKDWCKSNDKKASDVRTLIYYVKNIVKESVSVSQSTDSK